MKKLREWLAVYSNRAYLYGLLVAGGPLLIGAGFVSDDTWNKWLNLAMAVLMISGGALALSNPTPDE